MCVGGVLDSGSIDILLGWGKFTGDRCVGKTENKTENSNSLDWSEGHHDGAQ